MERIESFRPKVSILLNITADHLDRYAGMDDYAAAKGNAFRNQTEDDIAVIPAGDRTCLTQARRGFAWITTFGDAGDIDVTEELVVHREQGVTVPRTELVLQGHHNAMNFGAAMAAAAGACTSASRCWRTSVIRRRSAWFG